MTRAPFSPPQPSPFASAGRRPPAGLRDSSGFLPASTELAWLAGNVGGPGVLSEQNETQSQGVPMILEGTRRRGTELPG